MKNEFVIDARAPPKASVAITTTVITVTLAAALGAVSTFSVYAALASLVAVWALTLLVLGQRMLPVFFVSLALLLFGYAFAGRGFAHLGVPPLFLSEPVLFLAVLVIVVKVSDARIGLIHLALIVFMFWGLIRTLPYVERDGISALRDAVVWGYGLFAIAISLAVRPRHFEAITALYGRFAPLMVCWTPILFILDNRFSGSLPQTLTGVTVPSFSPGDVGVHLAAIAGFAILGLYTYHYKLSLQAALGLAAIWCIGFIVSGSISRGAFLACVLALGAACFFRPSRVWLPALTLGIVALIALAIINPTVDVKGRSRDISVRQLTLNTISIVGVSSTSGEGDLAGTRNWRLEWWEKIIDYTIYGPYFWTGKGFGVNLADDDGFQVFGDRSLRSPHNTHLTVLARMGVPGLVMWIALNVIFVSSLLRAQMEARKRRLGFRAAFIAWLLIYWLAMTVTGAFSLYLESPHLGIWFWTIFGIGLAVLRDDGTTEQVPPPSFPKREWRRTQPRRLLPAPGIAWARPVRPIHAGATPQEEQA